MSSIAHWPVRIQGIGEDTPSNMLSLYQIWTTGALLNILLGPPNHDSQNSPDETHELGSWAKKWDDVPWVWTMGFDAFLYKYGLFWALKEVFPKSMIMLTWCGLPMKWSHVVWKICPQHIASSKALLAARASTSITVDGIGICYDKEAITRLTSFCITTPKLAVLLEAKVAPSKFTFTHCWSGAVQVVACCCRWIDRLGVLEWDSSSCSRECSSILPRGSDGFPNLRLFRRFHRFQVTIANNFAS